MRESKRHDVKIYKVFRGKQWLEAKGDGRKVKGEVRDIEANIETRKFRSKIEGGERERRG